MKGLIIMMRKAVPFLVIVILFLTNSCSEHGTFPPAGSYSQVLLITETGKIEGFTEDMVKELEHVIDYYNKNELQFYVKVISIYDLNKEQPAKNMVFLGLPRQGKLGEYINTFIGPAGVRSVLEGKLNVFKKLNYPIPGQLSVIVTASSPEYLDKVIKEQGAFIRNLIEEANRERLRDYLLKKEDTYQEKRLKSKYGFTVRMPQLYRVNQEREDVPGVEIVRIKPHRGLTVSGKYWEKKGVSLADSNELYKVRADLAWKMYDKDVMRRDLVKFSVDHLGTYEAVRMDGYWENSQDVYGGPFICFFIYDEFKSRLWVVDCVVFAPGFKKHPLLRELLSIAETFRI